MVYNPVEVLRQSESMCREIYGILENNAERPDLAAWIHDVHYPDIIMVRMCSCGAGAIKGLFAAGYHLHFFGLDNGYLELWISKY